MILVANFNSVNSRSLLIAGAVFITGLAQLGVLIMCVTISNSALVNPESLLLCPTGFSEL